LVAKGSRKMKDKSQRPAKLKKRKSKRRIASNVKAHQRKGLGTRIAEPFGDIALGPGEEIPELRGFTMEPPDFGE